VDAELAERSNADRLFLDHVGHGDSDKPLGHPYSRYERADLVEALWRVRSVEATVVVAFDYSCIVSLELVARRIERQRAGEGPGTVIRTCLLANGGLFADGHTDPWFTTPLFNPRAGGPLTWVGQHSRRAFAPFFRPVFSRSYRVTAAGVEQAYQAISRRDGVRVLPAEQCVATSSAAARTDSRHGNCACLGSGSAMRRVHRASRWPPRHRGAALGPR
jgi:pimeloyl-ACP methyl ester carboxylesterase